MSSVTDAKNQVTTFGYDAIGRLTLRTNIVGGNIANLTSYFYDFNGNLTNVAEGGKSCTSVLDAYDRLITYTCASGDVIKYNYDQNGNLKTLTYPGGHFVTYDYDALNRLTTNTDWAGRKTIYTYDLASRVTSITRPNGTVRSNYYDDAGQLTNIVEQTAFRAPIAFFQFKWNNAGRMDYEFMAPTNHPYTPPTRTMVYDDDNRLTTFNGASIVNDDNGNMTSGPLTQSSTLTTYNYDARNRLTNVAGTGALPTLSFAYDPTGARTAITNGTNVTLFVVDPKTSQVLMRVRNGATNYYIYGLGLMYEVTETATSTTVLTYHYDYRGSAVALTDTNGNVTDRMEYSAYGTMTLHGGTNDTPFLYNGRHGVQTDPNCLLYMRARYYNPYICRFINADPSGFGGGLNMYAFADGNPISLTDPFGLGTGGGLWSWFKNSLNNIVGRIFNSSTTLDEGQIAHAMVDNIVESVTVPGNRPMQDNFHTYDPDGPAPIFANVNMATTTVAFSFPESPDSPAGLEIMSDDAIAAEKTPTLSKPPVPSGPKPAEMSKLLGFGVGENVPGLQRTFTKEFLQQNGITKDIATQWLDVYRWQVQNMPRNPAAPGRLKLMERIVKILE